MTAATMRLMIMAVAMIGCVWMNMPADIIAASLKIERVRLDMMGWWRGCRVDVLIALCCEQL